MIFLFPKVSVGGILYSSVSSGKNSSASDNICLAGAVSLQQEIHCVMKKRLSNREKKLIKKLRCQYEMVGNPQYGLIKVVKGGKYGFVNMDGVLAIPLMYDWASAFIHIKLYGKWYIASWVNYRHTKMLIGANNKPIVQPMDILHRYYIINDKLWVKNENGYNLISRRGKALLQTNYQYVVSDRFRQPKNVYLVKKQGCFGAIYIYYNNTERVVLPFESEMCSFWRLPGTGTFIQSVQKGEKGLFDLKGKNIVPCLYDEFAYETTFRKGFVLAYNKQGISLYDSVHPVKICSDPYSVVAEYSFYHDKQCYYTAYTTEEEYLLDQKGRILVRVNKRKDVSYFHFLMNQQREQFRFKTFQSLLSYCKKKRDKRISHKEQEEILVYAYFFMEEMLQQYATCYGLRYTRFGFLNRMSEKWKYFGLCSPKERKIDLSLSLLLDSEDFIKKAMLHELLHLKYPCHSKKFYQALEKFSGTDIQSKGFHIFLDTLDWFAVIKQKKRDLFILVQQGILQKNPSVVSLAPKAVVGKAVTNMNMDQMAALEVKSGSVSFS